MEDISFYEELRRRQVPVSPVRPPKVICAHSYHAKVNISGGEFSGALRCGDPIDMESPELLALLPLAQEAERRISAERSRDQSVGEKCGFRVSLSEKKEPEIARYSEPIFILGPVFGSDGLLGGVLAVSRSGGWKC